MGCCALSVASVSCEQQKETQAQQQEAEARQQVAIKTFPIIEQNVTDYGEWFGYIRGKEDADIYARISGFLMEQCYKDGQFVHEGDVLFRIEPDIFQTQLDQALANLEAAKAAKEAAEAELEKARLDLTRFEGLVKSNAASAKELDDARQTVAAGKANVDAALANIEQQEAAVATARINLDYCTVVAPFNGVVGEALASQGDLVSSGTKLANMTTLDPMFVRFSLNSSELIDQFRRYGSKKGGQEPPKPPPFEIVLENGETYPIKGKLQAMESIIDDNGLVDVQGEIANPDGLLRAGMSVRVRVAISEKKALLVPQAAIRTVMRQSFILAVAKDKTPRMIPVTTDGVYPITVNEKNGYSSQQDMVAITSRGKDLDEYFREMGYSQATEVPVVADPDNSVVAVNISSANSRLSAGEKPTTINTTELSFRPSLPAAMQEAVAKAKAAKEGKAAAENPNAKASLPPFMVKVMPLMQQTVAKESEWFGSLRGINETVLRAKITGFLLEQCFTDGTLVKKGDLLFKIDPAPYEAALAEAKAKLSAAKAAVEQTAARVLMYQLDLKRYEELAANASGAIEKKRITDTRSALKAEEANLMKAKANVSLMEASVRQAEINLSYTEIYAPFDGRVGIHRVSKGDLIDATAGTPLVNISSLDPIRVDFLVPTAEALEGLERYNRLKEAETGEKKPPLEFDLVLEDNSVYPVRGHVVATDNALSESTGTLKLIGHVENVDGGLRSGMAVRVRAGLQKTEDAYLVPARAPLFNNGQHVVVLLDESNAPVVLPVTTGPTVNIPVTGPDGKAVVQPMQVIDVNREASAAIMLAIEEAPSLEALVFKGAGVSNWGELLLHDSGAANFRELAEKQAGKPLPDDAPAQAGVSDWGELLLKNARAKNYREMVLKEAGAKDELDLIARARGFKDLMAMTLANQGIKDPAKARVVVEGSIAAAQTYGQNEKEGARVNKLTPVDFIYQAPQTVTPSVTAEEQRSTQLQSATAPADAAKAAADAPATPGAPDATPQPQTAE